MSITNKKCMPCNVEKLKELMQSARVQEICDEIRLLDGKDAEELGRLKRQLPIITPHAKGFTDGRRSAASAVASGLVMLDVDHVDAPQAWYEAVDKQVLSEERIYLVAVTPSGHGLRIIAEREGGESIEQGQQRIAKSLGIPNYDSVTKDLSRASFVMPMSYVLYMDEKGLGEEPVTKSPGTVAANDTDKEVEVPEMYGDVPYKKVVDQLILLLGGTPVMGERNTFYFTLVLNVRYLVDFDPEQILRVLPDFGLSEEERRGVIASAVHRPRRMAIPDIVNRAVLTVKAEQEAETKSAHDEHAEALAMPKLPKVLEVICNRLPESFRPAMVVASLPILGALATRVRFNYLDNAEHSFSFMSCITAPAATGKSFIRRPVNLLLTPIDEQDEIEREKEQEYKEALRAAKNSKNQPENPRACPRNNGINVSVAKLLQLLSYSEGKHLIGIGEEIDTLVKTEKAGVWSQKSDIYRLGFDNAKYGQNYMSDNSFSANVPVYYNLLLTGTPGGMYRFFKDVEDGLVTRFCFAQLPDMFASEMPDFQRYTDREEKQIIAMARMLNESSGTISCPAVDTAIRAWLEEKRLQAIESDSRAVDTFRRRSAVIGFRAGYLAALMSGCTRIGKHGMSARARKEMAEAAAFARYIAEYVFRNQMSLFGDQFEKVAENYASAVSQRGQVRQLLQLLPEEFSRTELMALRVKGGQNTKVAYVIHRWKQNGLIEEVSPNRYKKL